MPDSKAKFDRIRPVLRIHSYEEAVAHYIDWLGFEIEWEWRHAPGEPVIMQVSRDGVDIHLVEGGDHPPSSWIQIHMDDVTLYAEELNAKRPGSVTLADNYPYVQQFSMDDPFGNQLAFERPVTAEEREAADVRAEKMRGYVRERLAAGDSFPTPEELAEAVFPPATFSTKVQASNVLFEFPDYVEATCENRAGTAPNRGD